MFVRLLELWEKTQCGNNGLFMYIYLFIRINRQGFLGIWSIILGFRHGKKFEKLCFKGLAVILKQDARRYMCETVLCSSSSALAPFEIDPSAFVISIQWEPMPLFPRLNRLGREVNCTSLSSADLKKGWSYTSTLLMTSWRVMGQINVS